MEKATSIGVLILACFAALLFLWLAVCDLPYAITRDSEGWGVMLYKIWYGPLLAAGILFFAVLPSAFLFLMGGRQTRDRISLMVSMTTLGLIVLTWILSEPLRQLIIFGR